MTPDDIEKRIMDASRAAKIEFLDAIEVANKSRVRIENGLWDAPSPTAALNRFEITSGNIAVRQIYESYFELAIPRDSIGMLNVPVRLLRASWVGADGGLELMLHARPVLRSGGFFLET